MSDPDPLPKYAEEQFKLGNPPECDAIMKGGITSGIVYPYAILEIATRYRFRSVGGTSAGAIAAAFAAAAEYSRSVRNDPAGFVRLQRYCDELPERLLGLFQPDPELDPVVKLATSAIQRQSFKPLVGSMALSTLPFGLIAGIGLALLLWWVDAGIAAIGLAFALGFLLGWAGGVYLFVRNRLVEPLTNAWSELPRRMFGFCSGLTQKSHSTPAVTDWLHRAIQDIAFGSPKSPRPLTFGDLEGSSTTVAPIQLRMVTTNLSMMRPHTLPEIGISAGFNLDEWEELFPIDVIAHLKQVSSVWKRFPAARRLPQPADLPIIVATRMSLSFPLLFKAVPLYAEDYELFRIVRGLGGQPKRLIRQIWMSDGGISSNFPIHLFDSPLPTRPTFAFSLDGLEWDTTAVIRRVLLPQDAWTGLGVAIQNIESLSKFAWQVFYSAKDWQDQLLSGMTGQRERIAHIYLSGTEGGLNLKMKPDVSRTLMGYGLIAGRKFASGEFNFNEHRWRRLLAFYRNSNSWIDRAAEAWDGSFRTWYQAYAPNAQSYRLSGLSKRKIGIGIDVMLVAQPPEQRVSKTIVERSFPKNVGQLRNSPKF